MAVVDFAEKFMEIAQDLRVALRKGWLEADDRSASCQFCGEAAEHNREARGYLCQHAADCLMVKHARLVGDVNDPEDD